MNYKPHHEVSKAPQHKEHSHEDINDKEMKYAIEQLEREKKHEKDLVEQQKTMADMSPPQRLKTMTPEEDAAHNTVMLEKLNKLRSMGVNVDQSHLAMQAQVNEEIKAKVPRIDSNQLGLEAKAIPSRAKEGLTNQSSEDFLKLRMEQIGQEAAAFQANLVKELADIKAQGSVSNIMKQLLAGRNRASYSGDIPLPDGQDDKKKDATGDSGDGSDSSSTPAPAPQKKVDDGSGNVYSQPYTQNSDYEDKSFEQVSWSEPSEKVSWRSKDDLDIKTVKASEISENMPMRSKDDSKIASLKERDMLQLADVMHRAKFFLSKKEMARENTQISLMLQNIRQYQEAYNKGEEVSMDHFHTAIQELNESLQEKEQGKFRENLGKKQEVQELLQMSMEQQKKPRSVGKKVEQGITHSERKGSTGKRS